MKAENIRLFTQMRDYGQMIDRISFTLDRDAELRPEDFVCSDCFYDLSCRKSISGVKTVEKKGGVYTLTTDPFLYRADFRISGKNGAKGTEITKETAASTELLHGDWFSREQENGVKYRLYTPAGESGRRPLILFLHGAGGSGEDNELQLTDTLGAIRLAERCPDMYVLAPQAPSGGMTMEEANARRRAKGDPFKVVLGADTDNGYDSRGWNRWYLARVADIIRRMIGEGKVDAARVYAIGMSMGGGGCLKMMSVAPDLFAAEVPICPSMNGETWPVLRHLPEVPTYIATAYIDHAASRHAYILQAVAALWKEGRKDVEFTLFTEDELAAYGIGTDPDITTKELYSENHSSWILVLHNEHGILDWMFSHVRRQA